MENYKKLTVFAVENEGIVYSLDDTVYILTKKLIPHVIVNGHVFVNDVELGMKFESSNWSFDFDGAADYYQQVEASRNYALEYLNRLKDLVKEKEFFILLTFV